ncbi:MAG TPA: GNAT family N-acetyltransferase [Gaiellaceae bacterium]
MVRRASNADLVFLRSMLAHAYHWRVAGFEDDIPLSRYTESWGRPGDLALIAMEGGHPIGAAWLRRFTAAAPGYGFVDGETPELTIAVVPSRRRHGVGQELLDALLAQAQAAGYTAVALSVEQNSPAVAFYERNGFAQAGGDDLAFTMVKRF